MIRTTIAVAVLTALTLSAPRARAQSAAATTTSGPTLQAAALAPRLSLADDAFSAAAAARPLNNGEKLMIIGGVGLITGAIIGDTPGVIIMIASAGVGLYGLYLDLGRPHGLEQGPQLELGYRVDMR